ncbi:MAG: hypothetical protein WA130_11590 [Candidatus Methanoperedens sp.]
MVKIEANIYEIENLNELNCEYRIYNVRGLNKDSEDYDKNIQLMVDRLSRSTKSPCIAFRDGEETFIAQPDDFKELSSSMDLIGLTVKIEKQQTLRKLDFEHLNKITAKIATRFLQFSLQNPLYNNPALWQPQSGHPFYRKVSDQNFREKSNDVDLYHGFTVKIIQLPNGKMGVCVDISSKYVSRFYLPTKIDRNEFRRYKGQKCLYEYGNTWYEVRIDGLNDLKINEVILQNGKTLYDEVHDHSGQKKSQNLLTLPKDCSVLFYINSQGQQRNVPSGLCRLTYKTDHPSIKQFHSETIKSPHIRRKEIQFVVDRNLRDITFGSVKIKLSQKPISFDGERILIPDIEFGNNKVLSVRGTLGAIQVPIEEFGKRKKQLVYYEAGLFIKKPFDRQYFILPESIYQSFGTKFLDDLKSGVQQLYPPDSRVSYDPIVIPYDDSVQKSIYSIGKQIIQAITENDAKVGYGVVMIPRVYSERMKKDDELGNLVMKELRKREIFVSIIHTATAEESFEDTSLDGKESNWELVTDGRQQGKYKGYLKNVALNKILLLNSHWPFVLKTPLNADLTIGIDVKNNTAGFTLIYKSGAEIRFFESVTEQKEQLTKSHIYQKILEIMREEKGLVPHKITSIVVHRDGIFYPSEREGIRKAIETLSNEGTINQNASGTFVEIRKTSGIPLRLFEIQLPSGMQAEKVYNPIVGTYRIFSENEFFICNTGYPFRHEGTTKPLHVIRLEGHFPIKDIIEDVFYLSNLTWTKIDDCSRDPISIKMTDIRLREIAGEYDEDLLKFGEDEEDETGEGKKMEKEQKI